MPIKSTLLRKRSFHNKQNFEHIIHSSNDEKSLSRKGLEFLAASDHEQHLVLSSPVIVQEQQQSNVPRDFLNEQEFLSSTVPIEHLIINTNKTDILSSVIRIERSLSPSLSQLIPDPIINDKQTTNRIFNQKNSIHFTYPSQFNTIIPIDSSLKKHSNSIHDDLSSSSNNIRYYQIGTIFTSTSTFIMHQNEVIAQTTRSDRFLSDTIFIILIATLTIIILLFCLVLFCLCRRTTKRNISPSFDGACYIGLNEHSLEIPCDNDQQRISKYENDLSYINDIPSSYIQTKSSINHPSLINNDRISLHNVIKQKSKINEKNLKRKRLNNCCYCCCSNSKTKSSSTKINKRNRMKRNEI